MEWSKRVPSAPVSATVTDSRLPGRYALYRGCHKMDKKSNPLCERGGDVIMHE